jgi:hypothetical protein
MGFRRQADRPVSINWECCSTEAGSPDWRRATPTHYGNVGSRTDAVVHAQASGAQSTSSYRVHVERRGEKWGISPSIARAATSQGPGGLASYRRVTPEQHSIWCAEAARLYVRDRNAADDAADWRASLWTARRAIVSFLRASKFLTDVSGALQQFGGHSLALRHLLAPPISQDQFKLICPHWTKNSENTGSRLSKVRADAVEAVFLQRLSQRMAPWLRNNRSPSLEELASTIGAIAPLIASQKVATARRQRLSAIQELAVVEILTARHWTQVQSGLVTTSGGLPAQHFMHKARFASGPNENQEVDIACGLGGTVVLAMECKVTNDTTNSVKRINDVLKKASAWKRHWGSFVRPAALLQGVIKPVDVHRLLDADVEVFWAHHLERFASWIDEHTAH